MEDSHFNSSYFWSPVPTVQGQIENAMFLNKMKEQLGPDKGTAFPHSSTAHYPTAVLTVPGSVAMDTGAVGRVPKQEGGGGTSGTAGAQISGVGVHLHPPHTSQNITVVPVTSTGIMTAAGLVITTPQGALVTPPASSQSFVSGPPTTTMIVSALHPTNTEAVRPPSLYLHSHYKKEDGSIPPAVVMPLPSKRGRKKKSMMPRAGLVSAHALATGSDALILAHLAAGGQHNTSDPYDLSNDEDDHPGKDGNKSYRCRMCAVTFFNKSDMQIHAKSHTEAKPHKCPHCSKSFANSSYLSQHIRIHSGAKPYSCSYCQKTFRQLSHLQQHTRIHTGDRPYKCSHPGCEKTFTQLSNLQSHRRQHNKDKPYKCHNCNRGYTDATSLEVHLSTHTVKHAKLFSCGLCNRAYTSETYLMKHMRKHNPDPLTVAAAVAAQQAQQGQNLAQPSGAGSGRGRGRGRGAGAGTAAQAQNQPNPTPPTSYSITEGIPCPFDLHQYKTVSAGEIQYKPVTVADLTAHKDLCLTVSTSAIQVEHMNS
ncbi:zinc finger protein 384-like isoform X4 [Sinocyclocheilus anshuiensis]|uniref:zinc finger protein 384-like isoform X4 n=1 Tax=Sinocyclocheilus anshuiensis TaxID=1608454 RepID=UPI0007B9CC65|nr:PREDICTED: zinc finger protein 384-like isoform X4 [Sinocyclocheilus anshuiensis]